MMSQLKDVSACVGVLAAVVPQCGTLELYNKLASMLCSASADNHSARALQVGTPA